MAQIEINRDNFWIIYNFIENYKDGGYGLISLSEAIEKYFYEYYLEETKES